MLVHTCITRTCILYSYVSTYLCILYRYWSEIQAPITTENVSRCQNNFEEVIKCIIILSVYLSIQSVSKVLGQLNIFSTAEDDSYAQIEKKNTVFYFIVQVVLKFRPSPVLASEVNFKILDMNIFMIACLKGLHKRSLQQPIATLRVSVQKLQRILQSLCRRK